MAINRVALEGAWCKLIAQENQYFRATAEYLLLENGVDRPSESQIQEKISHLFHIYLSFSLRFGKRLSNREIESLFQASCGEELKESAVSLKRTPDVIKRHRMSAFKKLQSSNIGQAIYRATQLGYLPLKAKHPQSLIDVEETENASA
ncbi:helix-turn-helix domain-containing protein [Rickettsiella massiliensis]|uniref:hypothetical protein n=1 Tax=Rickettsiella massiliensis TaxID=676517 RepID=UPI00029A3744|nr:hypothetical protein [Rickettsiella massiliensis]